MNNLIQDSLSKSQYQENSRQGKQKTLLDKIDESANRNRRSHSLQEYIFSNRYDESCEGHWQERLYQTDCNEIEGGLGDGEAVIKETHHYFQAECKKDWKKLLVDSYQKSPKCEQASSDQSQRQGENSITSSKTFKHSNTDTKLHSEQASSINIPQDKLYELRELSALSNMLSKPYPFNLSEDCQKHQQKKIKNMNEQKKAYDNRRLYELIQKHEKVMKLHIETMEEADRVIAKYKARQVISKVAAERVDAAQERTNKVSGFFSSIFSAFSWGKKEAQRQKRHLLSNENGEESTPLLPKEQ